MAHKPTYAVQQTKWLLDHLVGVLPKLQRHAGANHLCYVEVDDEFVVQMNFVHRLNAPPM